jgi:DNA gyrase/topoisomerase IV subunit A
MIRTGTNYESYGVVTRKNTKTIEISELPYGSWTAQYKETLSKMVEEGR